MLFNAEYSEEIVNEPHMSMFTAASPSPTRTMIKEANDHLQLLHQKVTELEKTVREQAEALIKKDELMQTRLKELAEMKDSRIMELTRALELYEQRVKKLEQVCKEKDGRIEMMSHKCGFVEELVSYTPLLEGLVSSLKSLPRRLDGEIAMDQSSTSNKAPGRRVVNRSRGHRAITGHNQVHNNSEDGNSEKQTAAEMKISRSFNINRNFSMSEDEDVM